METKTSMYVGSKLRKLRLQLDITQKEMATSVGLSTSYFTAIEIGKRKITKKMIEKLVEKYKIDKDYFFKETTTETTNKTNWCYCPHCGNALK